MNCRSKGVRGALSVMNEVLRSGAIILMGITVMAAGVVVAFYG